MKVSSLPASPAVGERWLERPCNGCKTPIGAAASQMSYLCPDCREAHLEALVKQLEPTYDATAMNNWDVAGTILRRYWCFNSAPPSEGHPAGSLDVGGWQTLGLARPAAYELAEQFQMQQEQDNEQQHVAQKTPARKQHRRRR